MAVVIIVGGLARQEHLDAIASLLDGVPDDEASNVSIFKNLQLNTIFEVRNYDRTYRGLAAVDFLSNWAAIARKREMSERIGEDERSPISLDQSDERFTRTIMAPTADADQFGPSTDPTSVSFSTYGYLQDLPHPPPDRGMPPEDLGCGVRSVVGEKSRWCMGEPRSLGEETMRICPQYGHYLSPRMRIGVTGVSP